MKDSYYEILGMKVNLNELSKNELARLLLKVNEKATPKKPTEADAILDCMAQPYKEPILDEVERKYLSDVIRPFRKKVDTISKFHTANTMQYIYFQMKDKNGWTLPLFKKGTMYKGMVQGKHYKLDELGL